MASWRALAAVGLAAVLAAGCAPPSSRERPTGEGPGGRYQQLILSPSQEFALGRHAYREILQEYEDRLLAEDSAPAVRVRRVTGRIAKAAEIEPLQDEIHLHVRGYRFEWLTHVVREEQANAFCLPAGYIFVFTGILKVTGADDDYLATVLAHEISHALAHHANERVARQRAGENPLRKLAYDRQQEAEADHIGVFLMTFAGYDPLKAIGFWKRMNQMTQKQGRPPEFLSDHPSHEHRIQAITEWAPKARAAKRAYDEGRIMPRRQQERR